MNAGGNEGQLQNWSRREWFGMVGGGFGAVALSGAVPVSDATAAKKEIPASAAGDDSLARADQTDPVPSAQRR